MWTLIFNCFCMHHTFWYISWQSCANKQRENSSWEGVVTETWADVSRDNSQRRFLAQYIVTTLLWYCFEWLQHCFNIATMCCAKNRRCESSRVTSPLWYGKEREKGVRTELLFFTVESLSSPLSVIKSLILTPFAGFFLFSSKTLSIPKLINNS